MVNGRENVLAILDAPFACCLQCACLQMAETKAAPKSKEPLPVERKLEMALSDIEKARPRQRKGVKVRGRTGRRASTH
jgi:hypothetical protein